jgi:MFS family permease
MGIHGFIASFGGMFTPAVSFAIGIAVNWRASFIVFGILSMIVGFMISRKRVQKEKPQATVGILEVFRIKGLLMILIFNVTIGLYMKGVEYFLPTYLTLRSFQYLGEQTAGTWAATAATLVLASGVPAQWIGGRAADRVGSKKVLIVVSAGIVAALLFLTACCPFIAFSFLPCFDKLVVYQASRLARIYSGYARVFLRGRYDFVLPVIDLPLLQTIRVHSHIENPIYGRIDAGLMGKKESGTHPDSTGT